MLHLFQVGVGSGGMPVLDLVARDERIGEITLVEPDVYKMHNVVRHVFPVSDVGQFKVDLAKRWLLERRPELVVKTLPVDLCDPTKANEIRTAVEKADVAVCAVDNEVAKHHFNHLMLACKKSWTLGEVLAGGIGGFVHRFVPGGPCYGCVASFLKRSVATEENRPADYSQPHGSAETSIPASKASIAVIASLHAQITLAALDVDFDPGFTSLLLTLKSAPGIFSDAYRPYKFKVPRLDDCLICRPSEANDLDRRLDEALDRLGPS